eukprot:1852336-Rhodomonas_salina.1
MPKAIRGAYPSLVCSLLNMALGLLVESPCRGHEVPFCSSSRHRTTQCIAPYTRDFSTIAVYGTSDGHRTTQRIAPYAHVTLGQYHRTTQSRRARCRRRSLCCTRNGATALLSDVRYGAGVCSYALATQCPVPIRARYAPRARGAGQGSRARYRHLEEAAAAALCTPSSDTLSPLAAAGST